MRKIFGRVFCFVILMDALLLAQAVDQRVPVDMQNWYRRDWEKCKDPTRFEFVDEGVHIVSDNAVALFWQIPTRQGRLNLDVEKYGWINRCERPPLDFNKKIRATKLETLLDLNVYRFISWRWKVEHSTIEDERLVDKSGKVRKKYDDWPARIGITILPEGSNTAREISYVWTKSLPEGEMYTSETVIIPFVWTMKWRRIIAESGSDNIGKRVVESRNLYEDFLKGYPGEKPGKILRVYLQTDTNSTEKKASTWYADIVFHKKLPERMQ